MHTQRFNSCVLSATLSTMASMTPAKALPNRAKQLRLAEGKKRARVAVDLGVDPSTLWRWEERRTPIPDEKKQQLAAYYQTSVAWLMDWPHENGRGQERAA